MRLGSLAVAATLALAAPAYAAPAPGSPATIEGRAHIQKQGDGTYVYVGHDKSVAGFVPFQDTSTFPDLNKLEGRDIQISGVVNDKQQITLTRPGQIKINEE